MGVVWVKGAVLCTTTGEDALVHTAVQEAHGVVSCDKFLVQPRVLVVHAGVHHGDDDAFAADAEVPRALWVDRRRTRLDRWRLHVAPKDQFAIGFDHDHVIKGAQSGNHAGVHLTEQEGVHSGHDQFDGKVEGFHRRHVAFVNAGAVRQTDPHWTECPVKRIVDAVPVEVQGRPLPPRSDLFSERPGAVVGMVRVWPSRSIWPW